MSFRWIPSELNHSDEGRGFFDRDRDSSKSLLHALAQRLARYKPSRTSQDLFSPALRHLDAGGVDRTSHTHVPAVSVRSDMQPDDFSSCTQHAPAVSPQSSCIGGDYLHRFVVLWLLCSDRFLWATSPGLVASQFTDKSQMQWTSAHMGAKSCHAQTPTMVCEVCPDYLTSGPSSSRQAPADSEFPSEDL